MESNQNKTKSVVMDYTSSKACYFLSGKEKRASRMATLMSNYFMSGNAFRTIIGPGSHNKN